MKRFKRVLAMVLPIVLLLSFSACDKPGNTPAKNSSSASPTDVAFDFGGKEIRIAAIWDALPSENATTELGKLEYKRMKEIEKKYNCKFKAVVLPGDQINSQFEASAMTGEQLAEIVYIRAEYVNAYAAQGLLYPLSDVFDFSQKQFDQNVKKMSTVGDKTYAYFCGEPSIESTVYFNKGIFDRFGLENPYELMKKGQWTTQKFAEIAKKATRDTNGDGKTDVYGTVGMVSDPEVTFFIAAFGGRTVKKENGKYVSGLTDENTVSALNYLRKINIDDKSAMIPPEDAKWDFGREQFLNGKIAMAPLSMNIMDEAKSKMTDPFGVVPIPMGPGQKQYSSKTQSYQVVVMHNSIDPKLAADIAKIMTAYTRPLADESTLNEIATQELESRMCDEESVNNIQMLRKLPCEVFEHYGFGSAWWDSVNQHFKSCLRGDSTIASALATCNPVFISDLNKINEKMAP